MKKLLTIVVILAIILSLCAVTAFAAGGRFTDADRDGVCDNAGSRACVGSYCGENFVDADNDGLCDNYGSGHGCGQGYGHGHGNGCGRHHGHGCG